MPQARRSTWPKFFHPHNVRYPELIDTRLDEIHSALPLTDDLGVIAPNVLRVQSLVEQLRTTLGAIARFNQAVESKASGHEDYDLFASFPGARPVLAPRVLAALGEQRARFETATDL